jgi:hypothetical protein
VSAVHADASAYLLVQSSIVTATFKIWSSLKTVRYTTIVLTALLTGLLASTSMAAARPGRKVTPKCPPANEGVVVADAQAVLYKATTTVYESEEHKFVEGQQEIFGCAYGAKRSYHIGLPPYGGTGGSGGVDPVALVGPIVAYDVGENAGIEGVTEAHSSHEIWVRNLRTGKLIHRMPNGSPAKPGDVGLGDTTAIVVKSDGSVAWIVGTGDGAQVRSADKTGEHLLAAASPAIEPNSLALAGSTLYWTQGGKPMSAALN